VEVAEEGQGGEEMYMRMCMCMYISLTAAGQRRRHESSGHRRPVRPLLEAGERDEEVKSNHLVETLNPDLDKIKRHLPTC